MVACGIEMLHRAARPRSGASVRAKGRPTDIPPLLRMAWPLLVGSSIPHPLRAFSAGGGPKHLNGRGCGP